jgi:outer membrane protein assembly factor BamB
VVGDLVYVGSFDGTVYALHATTGALHWRSTLGGHIYNAPTLVQGVLYIGAAVDTGRLYAHTLSALDAATGKLRWSYTLPGYFLFTTPAVDRGVIYVGSDAGRVMALDAATGKLIWTFAAGGTVYAAPSIANGLVYVSTSAGGRTLFALDARTGKLAWSSLIDGESGFGGLAAIYRGEVLIGSHDRGLYALKARTGTLTWSYLPPDGNGGFFGSPAVANGVVYVSSYGVEMALDTTTGKPLWSYATRGVIYVPTVVDNSMVYVGSSNGTFYAFALQKGSGEKQART